jgi:sugar lactone lactonase YvrE
MAVRDFEIRDERFRQCIRTSANIERLHTGCRWTEGPVYFPAMRSLLFSDIPNDRMLRFDEQSEAVSVFRQPADYTNGNTIDRQGRLVSCQQGTRRVVRTEQRAPRRQRREAGAGREIRRKVSSAAKCRCGCHRSERRRCSASRMLDSLRLK